MWSKLLLVAAVATAAACGNDSGTNVTGDVAVGSGGANTFNPVTLTLSSKRNVTWSFVAGTHNVTFEDGAPASGNLTSGTFSRDFTAAQAGTFRYRCTIHSPDFATGMVGSVVVP
jgi:plastocyanin